MKQITAIFKNISPIEIIAISLISLSAFLILFSAFVDPFMIIKGFFFALCMVAVSYCDAKAETIPNLLLVPLALIGLIHVSWESLAWVVIGVPFLVAALIAKNEVIGGGDIKMLAAYGFVLGRSTVMGVLLGSVFYIIRYLYPHLKKKKVTFPFAPSLSLGCFISFILM